MSTHLVHNLGLCCFSVDCDCDHLEAILTSSVLLNDGINRVFPCRVRKGYI